jgi:hypothetical protein
MIFFLNVLVRSTLGSVARLTSLLRFFYRRVRDLHPRILQGYVSDVIESLKSFEKALAIHSLEGPCPVWPLFMAGCEAIKPKDREFFTELVQRGVEKFGISSFKTAVSVTFLLQRIPDFHVLECSRMQHFRIRSRTNVTIRAISCPVSGKDVTRTGR